MLKYNKMLERVVGGIGIAAVAVLSMASLFAACSNVGASNNDAEISCTSCEDGTKRADNAKCSRHSASVTIYCGECSAGSECKATGSTYPNTSVTTWVNGSCSSGICTGGDSSVALINGAEKSSSTCPT